MKQRWITVDEGRLTLDADYEALLRRHGLQSVKEFMSVNAGRELGNHRDRPVHRLELDGQAFYLKRYFKPHVKNSLGGLFKRGQPTSTARMEWDAMLRFAEAGLQTVRPVAVGEVFSFGVEKQSFLLTLEAPGLVPLNEYLAARQQSLEPAQWRRCKRSWIEAAAGVIRAMHKACLLHGDLYLKHLLVAPQRDAGEIYLFDLARAERKPRLSKVDVAVELAALYASAPFSAFSRCDRLRFYLAYKNHAGVEPKDRRVIDKVLRRAGKLLSRKKFRYFQDSTAEYAWSRAPKDK